MTETELTTELSEIYAHIQSVSIDADIQQLLNELDYCNGSLARSAQLQAEAGALLNKARGIASEEYANGAESFSATQAKYFIESRTSDHTKLYTLAERLNRTLTHRIDSIRTAISFEKSHRERIPN